MVNKRGPKIGPWETSLIAICQIVLYQSYWVNTESVYI